MFQTRKTRHQSPEASFDAQDQPNSPHSPACSIPRDSGMQPPPATQPVDPQVAAIQAIANQLARMQQEARDYQAAAARDREADRQEMLRRTAAAQPAPGPSHPDGASARPPHPPPSASQEFRRATAGQPRDQSRGPSPLQVQEAPSHLWGPSHTASPLLDPMMCRPGCHSHPRPPRCSPSISPRTSRPRHPAGRG